MPKVGRDGQALDGVERCRVHVWINHDDDHVAGRPLPVKVERDGTSGVFQFAVVLHLVSEAEAVILRDVDKPLLDVGYWPKLADL